MVITGTALLLFSTLSSLNQIRMLRKSMVDNLVVLAGAISQLSPASLSFQVRSSAEELLGALKEDKDIELAVIYNLKDEVFAIYLNQEHAVSAVLPELVEEDGYHFVRDGGTFKLRVFHSIILRGKRIGTLYVVSNLDKLTSQFYNGTLMLLVSMVFILFAAQFAARRMQRLITRPVFSLANTARQISELGDYSVRVERGGGDEIGDLIDDFNSMLDAIQIRDSELNQHRHNLELLVEERTEELRNRRDEALAAAQAKTEFLANMSHEIRTPMNGVIGVLSLLKGAKLTEEYRRLLETATRSADALMFIINDILDFSKIEAGMVEFESIPFDLRELIEETVFLFVDAVNMNKIDLLCFVPNEIGFVKGDPTRLRQILTNLVSNAVKFTSDGEVMLQVQLIEEKNRRQLLRFSVEDTGIGISNSSLPRLFDKFTQADGSTTRKYGGTGLGLSVCKQLVEMQGGDIGVKSLENEGAEFWFTLQFGLVPTSGDFAPCAGLDNKSVLIVDDNGTNRMILEHYLVDCKVSVTTCGSGDNALHLLEYSNGQGRPFDMILMDKYMPGMDGMQLAEKIRESYGSGAPEMFMLSSGNLNKEYAVRVGIKAVILKPVRRSQLYNILAGRASVTGESDRESSEPAHDPILTGRILLVDDEPINQKIACAILEKFGLDTDMAANGREAVQLAETNDYDIILMDIQMPEMSGYEATEIIRDREMREPGRRVTIIAMTANAMESTRTRCLEVGMDDFISKPIKPEILAERLRPWLNGEQKNLSVEPISVEQIHEAGLGIWDRQRALEFVGGDQDLLYDLIVLFLKRQVLLLQAVEDAVRDEDPESLDDAAHAYKGAVNHFAAESVRRVALELEEKGKAGDMTGTGEIYATLASLSEKLVETLSHSAIEGQ